MSKRRYIGILIALLLVGSVTGCDKSKEVEASSISVPSINKNEGIAKSFLTSGFKIRSVVTPQTLNTFDPLIFEVYVDKQGNGKGLVGYKDEVYDVRIFNDNVYVEVVDNIVVEISDITGHMILKSLELDSLKSFEDEGFKFINEVVASYKTNKDNIIVDSSYSSSDLNFDSIALSSSNRMSSPELISYILELSSTANTTKVMDSGQDISTVDVIPDKSSFWNNSWAGITIHDKTYSIGDFCNPDTYFSDVTPEGITPSYAYNGDTKVTLLHINYQMSDGRTSFMTTEGYVQSISTTCPFQFLEIKKGMAEVDLLKYLGIGLKKEEIAEWKPPVEGMTAEKGKGKTYLAHLGDYTVEIGVDSNKEVGSIKITNFIDFLVEGAKK